MRFTIALLTFFVLLTPAEARKMPKSASAKGYASHKAPKVKSHKGANAKRRRSS